MSLVICSNDSEKSYNRTSNFNSAFSWINSLKQTLKLPKNCEVAVQSVKVNKNSDVHIKPSSIWFQYWGKDLLTLNLKSTDTLQEPILCQPDMPNGESESVSVLQFADAFEKGMNEGLPHPDAYGLMKCQVQYDITKDPAFQGFKMNAIYGGDQSTLNIIDNAQFNNFTSGNSNVDAGWTSPFSTASTLTFTEYEAPVAPATDPTLATLTGGAPTTREWETSCIVSKTAPISRNGGVFIVDLLGLGSTDNRVSMGFNTRWQVGFVRGLNGALEDFGMPSYYNAGNTTGFNDGSALVTHPYPSFDANFYDIVVSCDQTTDASNLRLKIHMSVPDGNGGICMEEVQYWGNWNELAGANGANRYNMSSNPDQVSKLRFSFENEQVIISVGTGATGDTYTIVSGYDKYFGAGTGGGVGGIAKNKNVPKALNQSQWNLYPKICILGGSGKSVAIEKYGGMVGTAEYPIEYANIKNDWFCRTQNTNSDLAMAVDIRSQNALEDTNTYVPLGIAGGFFNDNVINFIIGSSPKYYVGTEQANMQSVLGFANRAVLNPVHGGTITTPAIESDYHYISDTMPFFSQTSKSLFVRLDNFTQNSYNAGVGRPSKILYHMPRFDTSNRDLGSGLYYEPQSKTYIKLGNSDPIMINELNLSICDETERLADDLIGRTIVCLHFRSALD